MRLLKAVLIGASVLVIVLLGWFVSDVRFLVKEKTSHELWRECKNSFLKKNPDKTYSDMEKGACNYGVSYWYCTYLGVRGKTVLRFDGLRKYTQCPNVRFGPTKS